MIFDMWTFPAKSLDAMSALGIRPADVLGLLPADVLGLLPAILSEGNPDGAVDQIDRHYAHGGGWTDCEGLTLSEDGNSLLYPGDPPMFMFAETKIREERVVIFPYSFVAVIQPDGSMRVARID